MTVIRQDNETMTEWTVRVVDAIDMRQDERERQRLQWELDAMLRELRLEDESDMERARR